MQEDACTSCLQQCLSGQVKCKCTQSGFPRTANSCKECHQVETSRIVASGEMLCENQLFESKSISVWRGVLENSTSPTPHSPLTRPPQSKTTTQAHATTQARAGALMAHHPAWVGHLTGGLTILSGWVISRVGPRQHPQYTRADYGQGAVGGSLTTNTAQTSDESTTQKFFQQKRPHV